MNLPKEIIELSDLLSSLPGVGPKLSNRLAIYLSIKGKSLSKRLGTSLQNVADKIKKCQKCSNVTVEAICHICEDSKRDSTKILVVEDPIDLYNIEATGNFDGIYQVLHGVISPVNGIGPEEIEFDQLLARVNSEVKEIILALNPNVEGDSTSMFIKEQISKKNPDVQITRLAKGIPVGSDLEFVSGQTIIDSLNSRVEF